MNYINFIIFIISFILSYIGSPMIFNMLIKAKVLGLNYMKEEIPICMGLLFIFVQTITISIALIVTDFNRYNLISYLFAFVLIGLVGLLDDLIGDNHIKGFKGHIKSFFRGNLTTGGIKAGIGFFISLYIAIILSKSFMEVIVNTLIVALFTNLTNLFDLRPGRSIKVFLFISIFMLFTSRVEGYNFLFYSFYGILTIYFPLDLKGKAMMGDVGSNVLGITLGIYCGYTHSLIIKSIYLFLLIIIHIAAEKVSFSKIIENNRLLSFIDNIGR